jgi:hypothetical protein
MVAAGCKVLRRPGREAVLCAAGGGHYTYNSGSGVVWILMGWNGNSFYPKLYFSEVYRVHK